MSEPTSLRSKTIPINAPLSREQNQLLEFVRNIQHQMMMHTPPNRYKVQEPVDRPWLRGSDLPVCPLKLALDTVREDQRIQYTTFMKDFFTGTGSVIHAVLQKWFGVSGTLYGKWECSQCHTLYPKKSKKEDNVGMLGPVFCKCKPIPVCCEYVEFAPAGIETAPGFKGHIDGLLLIQGRYCVLEIKTTDSAKVGKRRVDGPDPKHELQATAYRFTIPEFLELDESLFWNYFLVIYYDRADPKNNAPLAVPYRPELFQEQVDVYAKTMRRIKKKNYHLIEGICKYPDDNKYCPYNALCFSPQRNQLIEELLPGYLTGGM